MLNHSTNAFYEIKSRAKKTFYLHVETEYIYLSIVENDD